MVFFKIINSILKALEAVGLIFTILSIFFEVKPLEKLKISRQKAIKVGILVFATAILLDIIASAVSKKAASDTEHMNVHIDVQKKMCFNKRNKYDINTDNEPVDSLTDQNTLDYENQSSSVSQNDEEDLSWESSYEILENFEEGGTYSYGEDSIIDNDQSNIIKDDKLFSEQIMQQIYEEIGEENVIAVNVVDILGSGKESIIVTTSNASMDLHYEERSKNRLVILDIVENKILHNIEDLFGSRSSLKTSFSYSLTSDSILLIPIVEYAFDFLGDSSKEIIVKYIVWGSTYGANGTAIFKYSQIDSEYKLIGTYPMSEKIDLYEYDIFVNRLQIKPQVVETNFISDSYNEKEVIRCHDVRGFYNLNHGQYGGREYWINTTKSEYLLATVNIDYYEDNPTYINIYKPIYDARNDSIKWRLLYSEYVTDFPDNYSNDNLIRALADIMKCNVSLVEKNDVWTLYGEEIPINYLSN